MRYRSISLVFPGVFISSRRQSGEEINVKCLNYIYYTLFMNNDQHCTIFKHSWDCETWTFQGIRL